MQTQGIFLNFQERKMVGSFGTKLRKTQKLELKARSICKTKKKVIIASWNQNGAHTSQNQHTHQSLDLRKEPPPPFQ
jgi:hypothetical protein